MQVNYFINIQEGKNSWLLDMEPEYVIKMTVIDLLFWGIAPLYSQKYDGNGFRLTILLQDRFGIH